MLHVGTHGEQKSGSAWSTRADLYENINNSLISQNSLGDKSNEVEIQKKGEVKGKEKK